MAPPFCSHSQYCDACIGFSLAHTIFLDTIVITHKLAHQKKQNQILPFTDQVQWTCSLPPSLTQRLSNTPLMHTESNLQQLLNVQYQLVDAGVQKSIHPLPLIIVLPPVAAGDQSPSEVEQNCIQLAKKLYSKCVHTAQYLS